MATSSIATQVYNEAVTGGYNITGPALAAAIRCALHECTDRMGHLNISQLYDLTCQLESLK